MQSHVLALSNISINCLRLQKKATPGGVQPRRVYTDASPTTILKEILWLKELVGLVQCGMVALID